MPISRRGAAQNMAATAKQGFQSALRHPMPSRLRANIARLAVASHGLLLLSACETIPPPPQVVHVSVPTPCLPSTPLLRPKTFTDAELAVMDDFKFVLAVFNDRRALLDYSAELEAVLQACK